MKTLRGECHQVLSAFSGNEIEASRLARTTLLLVGLIYLHVGLMVVGGVPAWTLACSLPILLVRWIVTTHELSHLLPAKRADFITALAPVLLTCFSLGYRELQDIHYRHHRFMATPQDPEYYQIRGPWLVGLLNAMTSPEQAFLRWVAERRISASLLIGCSTRLVAFVGLIAISGPNFLWYWLPMRLTYGFGSFVFFYHLHRRGEEYSVYPLLLPSWAERLGSFLFGRNTLLAICHHDVHHGNPMVKAQYLPIARLQDRSRI